MNKQILTIGYEIPGFNENHVDFYDSFSLMDADILLVSPDSLKCINAEEGTTHI